MSINTPLPSLDVSISDIGGIDTTEREIPPGVTVLSGENATNRSSFLRAVATVFGGEHAFVKGDAPEGNVTMSIEDQEFSRTVTRQGQGVSYRGEPYLNDPDAIKKAELFSFLLRDNPIRQFVRSKQGSLRDILMEPVDTDAIERQTESLLNERREIQDKLESAREIANELAAHRSTREQLETEIESLDREINELETEIQQADQDLESITDDERELLIDLLEGLLAGQAGGELLGPRLHRDAAEPQREQPRHQQEQEHDPRGAGDDPLVDPVDGRLVVDGFDPGPDATVASRHGSVLRAGVPRAVSAAPVAHQPGTGGRRRQTMPVHGLIAVHRWGRGRD